MGKELGVSDSELVLEPTEAGGSGDELSCDVDELGVIPNCSASSA